MSTIYALATPPGRAGLAVIRMSGPDAFAAAERLSGPLPRPRHAALRRLTRCDGETLDEAIVLRFAEGESYTGEAVVELHCHGSPAVVEAVLDALSAQDLLRPAEAGEFTKRALVNGRMDLAQVEGLADLLAAETEVQRRQAWKLYGSDASRMVQGWQADLRRALALLEATIDFSDQDVPNDVSEEVRSLVDGVRAAIEAEIAGSSIAERTRNGFEVAIVGPPNSGKSTLINHLSRRDVALTSEIAGTTRDVLEVRMDIRGLPVTILDTAGLRRTSDGLEQMGINRALERVEKADMRLILVDKPGDPPAIEPRDDDMVFVARCDRYENTRGVSGRTGQGVGELLDAVHGRLSRSVEEARSFSRKRHLHSLEAAHRHLATSCELPDVEVEVQAAMIWQAVEAVGRLTGRVGIEDVLDDIFGEFCIGK